MIRRTSLLVAAVLAALAAVACDAEAPATDPFPDLDVRTITVDAEPLRVAVAADTASRSRGLSGIDSLGGLDGMLFEYENVVEPDGHPFWMRGVRFPLELAFFDGAGNLVDRVHLQPCAADEPCPRHTAAAPFRWVLETVPDRLQLTRDSRLGAPPTSFVASPNR